MYKDIGKLFGQSVIYGLSGAISSFLSVLLVPIYTRVLTPEDYGKIALVSILVSIGVAIANMGMSSAFFWAYFHAKKTQRNEVVSTIFTFQFILPLFISIIVFVLAPAIEKLFNQTEMIPLVRLSGAIIFFQTSISFPLGLMRAENRPLKYLLISFSKVIMTVVFSLILILYFKMGVYGYYWGLLIGGALGYVVGICFMAKNIKLKLNIYWLKEMLKYGVPMMPAGLAMWLLNSSDSYLLGLYNGTEVVGIYTVGYKIGMLITLVVTAVQLAYSPFVYSIFNESENPKEYYIKIASYVYILLFITALCLSLFSKEAVQIFAGEAFHSSYVVVPFVAFAYVAHGMYSVFSTGISVTRKTVLSTVAVIIAGAFNVLLNIYIIPRFGMLGASATTLISFIVLALAELYFSQRVYHIQYDFQRMIKLSCYGVMLITIAGFVNLGLIISVTLKFLLLLGMIIILFLTGFFTEEEKEKLIKLKYKLGELAKSPHLIKGNIVKIIK